MEPVPHIAEPLWHPDASQIRNSNLARFHAWLLEKRRVQAGDWPALFQWSVSDLEGFWSAVVEYFQVCFNQRPEAILRRDSDPVQTEWFPGATLNYAEHLLRFGTGVVGGNGDRAALLFRSEPDPRWPDARQTVSREDLVDRVNRVACAFRRLGVKKGDRVAGFLPNRVETVVVFLAAASLGAIWSNCPPELSSRGVLDRLAQIEPKVLVAVQAYRYGGKHFDRSGTLREIAAGLPTLRHLVLIDDRKERPLHVVSEGLSIIPWGEMSAVESSSREISFESVPFGHPLWILYSSGTTGVPKPIVHGHGGMLLEHLKALSLHLDLGEGDRFFWYTTAGWMMWNFLISGLAIGAVPVLYDGSPKFPDLRVLWKLVDEERINYFGTSAPYLLACKKAELQPRNQFGLGSLRSIGSTGAPLPRDGFVWVYRHVKPSVWLGSLSGGTDVCTAFVLSHPWLPVYPGKLQCRGLGAPIESWDENGRPVWDRVGELVLTGPMPCMPVGFWNDPDGSRFRRAYFEHYPGIWRHGDWIEIDPADGQCTIYGRSDSTLNRGGVRMGTSEFYRIVESFPEVSGSLVIDTTGLGPDGNEIAGKLLLFVALNGGEALDQHLVVRIRERITKELSPRYSPDSIFAVPEIPQTLNGKKLEVPVKRLFQGYELSKSVSREAMGNPDSLNPFLELISLTR